VLARHGGLILLSSLESGQFADVLLDLLEQIAGSGGDGRRFADAVADALEIDATGGEQASGALPGPSVLAFGPAGAGLAATVSGNAWADIVTEHGTERIAAGQPGMLLRCLLRSPVIAVRGGLGRSGAGEAQTDRFSRLDGGTLRAGGLAYFPGAGTYQRSAAGSAAAPGDLADGTRGAGAAAPSAGEDTPAGSDAPAGLGALGIKTPQAGADSRATPDLALPADALPAEPAPANALPAEPLPQAQPPGPYDEGPAPAGAAPADAPPADLPPGGGLPAPQAWPPLAGEPLPGAERWPTAAALIPEMPAVHQPEQPAPDVAMFPQGGAVNLGERDATIAPVGQPFEAVLLSGPGGAELDLPQRPPLSKAKDMPPGTSSYSEGMIISGVYCKNGHFDDPEALFCAVCGISMNQQSLVPRPGPRPPLGVLVLDDGSVFQLDKDYIIGREPSLDASVASGRSRPLRVADESGIVSRVHAKVQLDGWRVLITDLGSANGTRIKLPKQPADQGLLPQVPVVLAPGSQIDLGGRGFRYESHRGR
jgi:hypothetical protein